jgi:SAM-dependent methyltransferase
MSRPIIPKALQQAEFDRFADEYLATHTQNLKISGEQPDYFARYKIDELLRRWTKEARPQPGAVLDFGCGIGASLPLLQQAFPAARITGLDVSERSLAIARARAPAGVTLAAYDGGADIPLGAASFDLIFTACVFHHIDPGHHAALLASLKSLLKPGGVLCVFEHNPLNPVTRYIVATCPFDENAVLIPGATLKARLSAAGFPRVRIRYTGFFPAALSALRPLEPSMGAVPLGAQYYAWADA